MYALEASLKIFVRYAINIDFNHWHICIINTDYHGNGITIQLRRSPNTPLSMTIYAT